MSNRSNQSKPRSATIASATESTVPARIWVVPIAAIAVLLIGVFLVIRAATEISGL